MSLFSKLTGVQGDVRKMVEKGVAGTVSQIQGGWLTGFDRRPSRSPLLYSTRLGRF
jgi:hypothetical protein